MEQQVSVEKLVVQSLGRGQLSEALAGAHALQDHSFGKRCQADLDELIEANKDFWPELK